MCGGQNGVQACPSTGLQEKHGSGNDADDGHERANGDVHIGYR